MKVDKRQVICVLLGISLCLALRFVEKGDSPLRDGHILERNSYGDGEREQEVLVEGLADQRIPLTVSLQERQYGREEATAVFAAAGETLAARALGDNDSFDRVRSDLNLITWLPEYGLAVRWESEDSTLVETSGRVHGENCPETGTAVALTAILRAGEYSETYVLDAVIVPPPLTEEENRRLAYERFLKSLDTEQRTTQFLVLPEEYEGRSISYDVRLPADSFAFLGLGAVAAALFPLRDRQREKELKRRRERQMLLDYSEIVTKLAVFTGAGLPVRKAWERVVLDYEEKVRAEGTIRYAYEEMKAVYYRMNRGLPEMRAYAEFGNGCALMPYRKLAGLLEQNVKNGAESLRPLLEAEMESAFEQRKTLARRMGEEAGTKLLLPLFLLLAVVMALICMPAFLSFGL